MAWGAAIGALAGLASSWWGNKQREKENQRNHERQMQGNRELHEMQQKGQMDIWNKTNYSEQVKQLEKAGLSKALMYSSGGAGGTLGGTGAGSVSQASAGNYDVAGNILGMSMMKAQVENLKAQTEKTKAETAKTAGVDTEGVKADNVKKNFENEVNSMVTTRMEANYRRDEQELKELEKTRSWADWETYVASGYENKNYDDVTSLVAKTMKAGFEQRLEELKAAKTENNIKKFEETIKKFEAGLAESGISPNAPWGVKMIMDLLDKVNLNPFK